MEPTSLENLRGYFSTFRDTDAVPILRDHGLALIDVAEAARNHLRESSAGRDTAAQTANRLSEALARFTG